MLDWKIFALLGPLFFASYQSISKLLPKSDSVFLVSAYASLVSAIVIFILHFLLSPNKSLQISAKSIPLVIIIGILTGLGNFGILKAYNLGAPQSLFSPIFYISLIIYGTFFGVLFWHEKLSLPIIFGALLSIVGILIIVYYKK